MYSALRSGLRRRQLCADEDGDQHHSLPHVQTEVIM